MSNADYTHNPQGDEREYHTTQENPVTEQENPAVSKLREAFDTARNAIIEGSELAKLVESLGVTVKSLTSEVSSLQRDLEYIRNRNRELDEQVTQVRQARDTALDEAKRQEERAITAEAATSQMRGFNSDQGHRIETLETLLANAARSRDDAEYKAIELEDKLKVAEAKLAQLQAIICPVPEPVKPTEQPRDEVGKFQSYDHGSQSNSSGF